MVFQVERPWEEVWDPGEWLRDRQQRSRGERGGRQQRRGGAAGGEMLVCCLQQIDVDFYHQTITQQGRNNLLTHKGQAKHSGGLSHQLYARKFYSSCSRNGQIVLYLNIFLSVLNSIFTTLILPVISTWFSGTCCLNPQPPVSLYTCQRQDHQHQVFPKDEIVSHQ